MNFEDFNLNKPLLNAIKDLGFDQPTIIQQKAFSPIMSAKDIVGIAQTGTGKTFAYLMPCLMKIKFSKEKLPQILIIVPTRELVVQVVEQAEKLTRYMNVIVRGVYGGTNIKTQALMVLEGVDLLVATPGRLFDLTVEGTLRLKNVKHLIIDEVDEMLTLGFKYQISSILELIPAKRQNLMFSATITEDVEKIINDYFKAPIKIEAAPTGTPLENIIQESYEVPNFNTKINLLEHLLNKEEFSKVLVFTASKALADLVYSKIESRFAGTLGIIHAGKSQNFRFNTVKLFKSGQYKVIIATDLIARGIDISEVTHVINFDIPDVPEDYIHRIGRTGRADKRGNAITFIRPDDTERLNAIETLMKTSVALSPFPDTVEISSVLTEHEKTGLSTKNIKLKTPKKEIRGEAFHEKKDKNKKVNMKVRRAEQMKQKYGKPKTRGQKPSKRGR